MEGGKLEISAGKKSANNSPTATYKAIAEKDMEEEAVVSRPKSLIKLKTDSPEVDGADEKMLPKEETKVSLNSNLDMATVKVSSPEKQNGDAKLDIGDLKPAFVGLTKEELMKYANDPFWVRLRMILFVSFWILWAGMLVGAIAIIYAAPKCPAPEPRPWWEQGPLTEVPQDVTLETLKSSAGYKGFILEWTEDAYKALDDNNSIVKLLQAAKANDTNIIIELDPSTSTEWFEKSESGDADLNDFYVWKSPKAGSTEGNPEPPNNWKQLHTDEPSWIYSLKRKEFYYAPRNKPLLNFRNDNVTAAFTKVISAFINKGAAGVVLKNVPWLLADPKFEDETPNNRPGSFGVSDYDFYTHSKTENLPELGTLLKQWRVVVKNLTQNGPFMSKEELHNVKSYVSNTGLAVDLPVEGHVFSIPTLDVVQLKNALNNSLHVDHIGWPLWKVNTTEELKDAVELTTYLLPGTPLLPYGTPANASLVKLRESKSFLWGNTTYYTVANKTVFTFIREVLGSPGILVTLNPSQERVVVDFPKEIASLSKLQEVTVLSYSSGYNETEYMKINSKKKASTVPISPKSALVLSYVPPKKE